MNTKAIQNMGMQDAQSIVSVGAASAGWTAWLSSANEVLIAVATLIAIATGGWALYDKVKGRVIKARGVQDDKTDTG